LVTVTRVFHRQVGQVEFRLQRVQLGRLGILDGDPTNASGFSK
jgi:hypothetical protein